MILASITPFGLYVYDGKMYTKKLSSRRVERVLIGKAGIEISSFDEMRFGEKPYLKLTREPKGEEPRRFSCPFVKSVHTIYSLGRAKSVELDLGIIYSYGTLKIEREEEEALQMFCDYAAVHKLSVGYALICLKEIDYEYLSSIMFLEYPKRKEICEEAKPRLDSKKNVELFVLIGKKDEVLSSKLDELSEVPF